MFISNRDKLTCRSWLANKRDAASKGPDYTYTAAARLKTRTWAGGKRTRYDYRQGMLVAKRYFTTAASDTGMNGGNDPVTPDAGFTYNALGQPLNVITSSTTALSATRLLYNYHRKMPVPLQRKSLIPVGLHTPKLASAWIAWIRDEAYKMPVPL